MANTTHVVATMLDFKLPDELAGNLLVIVFPLVSAGPQINPAL